MRGSFIVVTFLFSLFCLAYPVYAGVSEGKGEVIDRIVAVVDAELITQSEIDRVLFPIYEDYKKKYKGEELMREIAKVRRDILSQMVEEKLIINAANASDIPVTDEEVDKKMEEVKQRFSSEEEFIEAMNKQKFTLRDLKKSYREEILKSKLIDIEVKSKITITFKEVSDYYQSHLNDFIDPEKVKVRGILIKPAAGSPEDWEDALAKINEVLSELKGGAGFEGLAKEYSQDASAPKGGDMGFISKDYMVKEIDEMLFSLSPHELSRPVRTKLGYYIFKIEAREGQSVTGFKEAEIKIKSILFARKFNQRFREWIEGLRKDAYISIK